MVLFPPVAKVPAWYPTMVLFSPVVMDIPLFAPTHVLLSPVVVLYPAFNPTNVLYSASVLKKPAENPTHVELSEVDRLYLTELDSKLGDSKNWQKELDGVVSELKKALIKASLEKLSFEIKNAQEFGKMEVVESLNKRFRDLSVKLKNL